MVDFSDRRREMIDCQIRTADVTNYSILRSMAKVAREKFVPKHFRSVAYSETNLSIGFGRYLLEPRIFAKMLELLNVTSKDLVLDIAPGYGYSSAVLAGMAEAVVAVENKYFAEEAQKILIKEAIDNAVVYERSLTAGLGQEGSVDAIIIQGGIEELPSELEKQVKIGGCVIAIFVDGVQGACWKGLRTETGIDWNFGFNALVPVLEDFSKKKEFIF
tara:strand:- start:351 stop:1001 length:651 start_codon:yes stop_codon:yes gene_type:complete